VTGAAREGVPLAVRFIAITVGATIWAAAGSWLFLQWYNGFALGMLGYFVVRYTLYAIKERRNARALTGQILDDRVKMPVADGD
jgi:hypothetical protein